MYNEEIKTEYLSFLPENTKRTHRSYFNNICCYEEKWKKDICFFSQKEFENMMQDIYSNFSTEKNLYNIVICLNRYVKWLKEHYNADCRTSFEIDYSKLIPFYYKSVENMVFKVIETMYEKAKENFPMVDVMNHKEAVFMNYNIAIGSILLSWYGLSFEEITKLEYDDILETEEGVYIKSRKAIVKVELPVMHRLKQIKSGKTYIEVRRNLENKKDYVIEEMEFPFTPYFFKKRNPSKLNGISVNTISTAITDFNQNSAGTRFNAAFLKENGNFCHAYKKAKEFPDLAPKNKKDNEYYRFIFDDWTKELPPKKFSELKYRYRKFLMFLESEARK